MARLRVTAFPTIFLLRDGNTYVYSGARNVASVSAEGKGAVTEVGQQRVTGRTMGRWWVRHGGWERMLGDEATVHLAPVGLPEVLAWRLPGRAEVPGDVSGPGTRLSPTRESLLGVRCNLES